jgi:hypothetical protein
MPLVLCNRSPAKGVRVLRFAVLAGLALAALAFVPDASADDVTFGSPLNDQANAVPYQNGWDQTVFNTSGPVGIAAPQPGLVHQLKLRGHAADGKPLDIKFRVIRPVGPGQWKAISTPLTATLPTSDGVHVYHVPNPRSFRVATGDYVAVFQEGFGGAGRRWQIFSANNDWTTQKVATDKNLPGIVTGFNDGELSPQHPVDQMGNSTVMYPHVEVLLQAVETPDRCPGTDLPQQPCQSKLYLGARVRKTRRAIHYLWTLRNGGPHVADGLTLVVNLPNGTGVVGLPPGCTLNPGPPEQVSCSVGNLPAPQNGKAVLRVGFVAVPHKAMRRFRAVGAIVAPGVNDPQGGSHHVKTISTSTRGT